MIAPPLTPAELFSKWLFINELLLQSARPGTPRKYIAPPLSVHVLSINSQSSITPFEPVHMIAPPSPELPIIQATVPLAVLFVKLEPFMIPPVPNQNTAPPLAPAVLLVNVQSKI